MSDGFEIRGADDIDALMKRINAHADKKAIRKELHRGLAKVTPRLRGTLVEAIPAALPTRGGLSAMVAGSTKWRTSVKGGKYAGVTLWARNGGHDIRTLTGSRLRHPVFGNRSAWVTQTAGVEPGVFLTTFEDNKPEVQREILRVLNDIARKVEGH